MSDEGMGPSETRLKACPDWTAFVVQQSATFVGKSWRMLWVVSTLTNNLQQFTTLLEIVVGSVYTGQQSPTIHNIVGENLGGKYYTPIGAVR